MITLYYYSTSREKILDNDDDGDDEEKDGACDFSKKYFRENCKKPGFIMYTVSHKLASYMVSYNEYMLH